MGRHLAKLVLPKFFVNTGEVKSRGRLIPLQRRKLWNQQHLSLTKASTDYTDYTDQEKLTRIGVICEICG
jgi:hypothetical protein